MNFWGIVYSNKINRVGMLIGACGCGLILPFGGIYTMISLGGLLLLIVITLDETPD